MKKITPLTPEQKQQVEALVPLAQRITRLQTYSKQEYRDCLSAAYEATIRAVQTFNSDKGESLKTWVHRYVRQHVSHERNKLSVPVVSTMKRQVCSYLHGLPYTEDPEEYENAAVEHFPDTSLRTIAEAVWEYIPHAWVREIPRSDIPLFTVVPNQHQLTLLHERLQTLTPGALRVLQLFYVEGLTMAEIGRIIGVTRERIRQRIGETLEKLREEKTK